MFAIAALRKVADRCRSRRCWLMVVLLAAQGSMLVVEARRDFVTIDEAGHLAAGLVQWRYGDWEYYAVNPPLLRLLYTLPAAGASASLDRISLEEAPEYRPEFWLAPRMAVLLGPRRYVEVLTHCRLLSTVLSLVGTVIIWYWGLQLGGVWAAAVAASLWAFDPLVLGHGHLITPDVGAAVLGLAAFAALWNARHAALSTMVIAGALIGAAMAGKFTALVLLPCLPLFVLLTRRPAAEHSRFVVRVSGWAVYAAAAWFVFTAAYGFTGLFHRPAREAFRSHLFQKLTGQAPEARGGPTQHLLRLVADVPLPVPVAALHGLDLQQTDFEARLASYLLGEVRNGGWPHYYVVALTLKQPLPWLLLSVSALAMFIRSPSRIALALALPAVAVLTVASAKSGFNHHLRYVLQGTPFWCMFCGVAVAGCLRGLQDRWARRLATGVAVVLICLAVTVTAATPYHLGYFNWLAWPPQRAIHYLADSNIDWGQDLYAVKRWLQARRDTLPVYIAFRTFVPIALWGVEQNPPPFGPLTQTAVQHRELPDHPPPGWHLLSATFVTGLPGGFPVDAERWFTVPRGAYRHYLNREPDYVLGTSVFVYRFPTGDGQAKRKTPCSQ